MTFCYKLMSPVFPVRGGKTTITKKMHGNKGAIFGEYN